MAIRTLELTVAGNSGLLLSNVSNSDPLGEGAKQKSFFSSKKKKSDDDNTSFLQMMIANRQSQADNLARICSKYAKDDRTGDNFNTKK
jgi:hypothetical protein